MVRLTSRFVMPRGRWRIDRSYAQFDSKYFLNGTIDPRLPSAVLAIFQILFSVACLITAAVFMDGVEHSIKSENSSSSIAATGHSETAEEISFVFGFGILIFLVQILLSSLTLYGMYANNAHVLLLQVLWQLFSPVLFGIICALIANKFVKDPLENGYLLLIVTFVSTPICAVDVLTILIYFKSYQLVKFGGRRTTSEDDGTTTTGSAAPTVLTVSSLNVEAAAAADADPHRQSSAVYEEAVFSSNMDAEPPPPPSSESYNNRALLPPPYGRVPRSGPPPRRYPPARNGSNAPPLVYSIDGGMGRRTTHCHSRLTNGSYSSVIWSHGDHFAELIHRTPTGQFVFNLREEFDDEGQTDA